MFRVYRFKPIYMIMSSILFMPTRAISPGLSHPTDAGGGELLGCPVGQCCIPNGTTSCQQKGANAEWKGMNRGSNSQAFFDKHDQLILKHCTNKIRSWICKSRSAILPFIHLHYLHSESPTFNLLVAAHLFSGAAWQTGWDLRGSWQAKQHSKSGIFKFISKSSKI